MGPLKPPLLKLPHVAKVAMITLTLKIQSRIVPHWHSSVVEPHHCCFPIIVTHTHIHRARIYVIPSSQQIDNVAQAPMWSALFLSTRLIENGWWAFPHRAFPPVWDMQGTGNAHRPVRITLHQPHKLWNYFVMLWCLRTARFLCIFQRKSGFSKFWSFCAFNHCRRYHYKMNSPTILPGN